MEPRSSQGGALLEIKDESKGKFLVSGHLYLPVERWESFKKQYSEIWLHIDYLDTDADFIGTSSLFDVKLDISNPNRYWGTQQVWINIPAQPPRVDGEYRRYPFDAYRVGVKTVSLRASKPGQGWQTIPLEFDFSPSLSSGFDAKRPWSTHDFMRKTESIQGNIADRPYLLNECPLIISRSPWFLMMALLLALLLLTPAIYLYYRREAEAGLELVGTIIAVATIRAYFLGVPSGWDFMPVDVVLAGIVVTTAAIPLWRLGELGQKNRNSSP
ncbi:hypothetical protein [Burkholderia ambifaria]|uniref:hypothetical protein n=1 Tax=Burkholderia ambifaria TaxID=152480 RepID=UPI0015887B06|nr:hypothetical protein [Burkholderia ambifaria]